MSADETKWRIWVSGYGTFDFEGTEEEAEEMRANKARCEAGHGRKWRADLSRESDRITAKIVTTWLSGKGVSTTLLGRLKKARKVETATVAAMGANRIGTERSE